MSRRDLIAERTAEFSYVQDKTGNLVRGKTLAHCYRGGAFAGILWAVKETTVTAPDGTVVHHARFIECDMLRYYREGNSGSWGYKDMECCMGPVFLSCPISYLEMVPIHAGEYCGKWRERVMFYWQKRWEQREAKKAAMLQTA